MRRFSLYKRGKIFYASLKNPQTSKYLPGKSTGKKDESEALLVVADWMKNGIPSGRQRTKKATPRVFDIDSILFGIRTAELTQEDVGRIVTALQAQGFIESATLPSDGPDNEGFVSYLRRFWNYDESPYVREKHAYGHSIGKRHCYEQTRRLLHWEEFFPEDRLRDITREKLQAFQLFLSEKGLAAKTINMILTVGTVALTYCVDHRILSENPRTGLRKFSGKSTKREILSPQEVKKLFSIEWKDDRAWVGNLVAMTTGLRSGEVLALKRENIGKDRLHVCHSWSFADGIKTPKNGEARYVPLLPEVRNALLQLADSNPWGPDGFIFYHIVADRPCDGEILRKGLQTALLDLTLTEEEKDDAEKRETALLAIKVRGICFHSWRHYYAKHLADKIELRKVQLATGHRSGAMAMHYSDHSEEQDFKDVLNAVQASFCNVLTFEKAV